MRQQPKLHRVVSSNSPVYDSGVRGTDSNAPRRARRRAKAVPRASVNGAALRADARPTPGPPLDELHFQGAYRRLPMCAEERARYDGHLEFWDRATQTALEVREQGPQHEFPPQKLAGLLERIALVRGKPIHCFGTMSLHLLGEDGRTERMMEPDQALYLHPERSALLARSQRMVVGSTEYPDVVLEVDNTTNVRRSKLTLYEAWRFPEVWVEVPDASPRPVKWHGLTIFVLQDGAYQEVAASRAFPGWTAEDIHAALNETTRVSEYTSAVLQRVGAALGEREGTGPDDDPLLREQRREAASQAHAAALEHRAAMVRTLLAARRLKVAADFPLGVPGFAEASGEQVAEATMRCADAADFAARMQRAGG